MPSRVIVECSQIGKHLYCYIPGNFTGFFLALAIGAVFVTLICVVLTMRMVARNATQEPKQPKGPLTPA